MTQVRLEPAAPWSGVKHSATEPLRSPCRCKIRNVSPVNVFDIFSLQLGQENGTKLRVALARAMMEYRMSSYRAIMASTAAILNSEPTNILDEQRHLAGSIPEEASDDLDTSALEAADEGVVGDLGTYMLTAELNFPLLSIG